MIPFASQRGGGQDLATHLLNSYDNEIAQVDQVRGALASDLHGAFREWQIHAETLTRCQKYLYSLSVNPDPAQGELTRAQYMDYIGLVETALGLGEQPRAIVFHTKYGREHCHVVWSRIDVANGKAVHLGFDHHALMQVTREFARDYGLKLPAGYDKSRQAGQVTLYEQELLRQTGLSKEDHIRSVTEAWEHADGPRAFVHALSERGYILATGKRPYVLVDLYGGNHALPKLIADKAVRSKDVVAFLGKDFPIESLPSVEEAEQLAARHLALIERAVKPETAAAAVSALRHQQSDRRAHVIAAREEAKRAAQQKAELLAKRHVSERQAVRDAQRARNDAIEAARVEAKPRGLAAFLGRVTGVSFAVQAWQRHQDGQRLEAYRAERRVLRANHEGQRRDLAEQERVRLKELERQDSALRRVDRRELAALLRDQRADQRMRDRSGGDRMPPIPMPDRADAPPRGPQVDLLSAYEKAKDREWVRVPDADRDFQRATSPPRDTGGSDERCSGPDKKPTR